jgi:hypothetical protein
MGGVGYNVATPPYPKLGFIGSGYTAATFSAVQITPTLEPLISSIGTIVNDNTIVLAGGTAFANGGTITLAGTATTGMSSVANALLEWGSPIDQAFYTARGISAGLAGHCIYLPASTPSRPWISVGQLDVHNLCFMGTPVQPRYGQFAPTTPSYATASGTFLEPLDPVHAAIHLTSGGTVAYVHHITNQYVPQSGAYVPHDRPYFVEEDGGGGNGQNFIYGIYDLNGTRSIISDAGNLSGVGYTSTYKDLFLGGQMITISSYNHDWAAFWYNINGLGWNGNTSSNNVGYYETQNSVAFNLPRNDNLIYIQGNFETNTMFYLSNEYDGAWSGLYQVQATALTAGTQYFIQNSDPSVHATGNFVNIELGGLTGLSGAEINVSDADSFSFTGLRMPSTPGTLAQVGSGVGGSLNITGLQIGESNPAPVADLAWGGSALISGATNSTVGVSGDQLFPYGVSVGKPVYSGAGTFRYNGNASPDAQWLDRATLGIVSAGGTGASVTGTLRAATLTVGSTAVTSATINVVGITSGALPAAPYCQVTPQQAAQGFPVVSPGTSNIVISWPTSAASGVFTITCD